MTKQKKTVPISKVKDWHDRMYQEWQKVCTYIFPETMKVLKEMENVSK